jgi:hypothetical protein
MDSVTSLFHLYAFVTWIGQILPVIFLDSYRKLVFIQFTFRRLKRTTEYN